MAIFHRLLEIRDTTYVRNLRAVQEVHTLLPKIAKELDTAIQATDESATTWTPQPILYLRDSIDSLSKRVMQTYRAFANKPGVAIPNAAEFVDIDANLQRLQREMAYSLGFDRTSYWR